MITSKLLLVAALSAPVAELPDNVNLKQVECLATAVYYEAKSEPLKGQIAVAEVTMNRVANSKFPNTPCKVVKFAVKSKKSGKLVCAYSWFCHKKEVAIRFAKKNISAIKQYKRATEVAIKVLSGEVKEHTDGATHFFNPRLANPRWKRRMVRTVVIGNHDFYR